MVLSRTVLPGTELSWNLSQYYGYCTAASTTVLLHILHN